MLKINENRTNEILQRAIRGKNDVRKAKRFYNRMVASVRASKGKYSSGNSYSSHSRNQARRIFLRCIAKAV